MQLFNKETSFWALHMLFESVRERQIHCAQMWQKRPIFIQKQILSYFCIGELAWRSVPSIQYPWRVLYFSAKKQGAIRGMLNDSFCRPATSLRVGLQVGIKRYSDVILLLPILMNKRSSHGSFGAALCRDSNLTLASGIHCAPRLLGFDYNSANCLRIFIGLA